jgi:hypothetical protein
MGNIGKTHIFHLEQEEAIVYGDVELKKVYHQIL